MDHEKMNHEKMLRDLVDAIGRLHQNGFVWDSAKVKCVCVCGCTEGEILFFKDHQAACPFRLADLALYGPGPEAGASPDTDLVPAVQGARV